MQKRNFIVILILLDLFKKINKEEKMKSQE